ncbi:MAG: hypothetical protein WKF57_08805 [Nakamurella sp.]
MRWEPDVGRGEWLRARIDQVWGDPWTVHTMVPRGFDRYARIFHRTRSAAEPRNVSPVPWHVVAESHGAAAHPLMSWEEIKVDHTGPVHQDPLPTADDFDPPWFGTLEEDQLSAIAAHLIRHTTTPDQGVAAIWDGFGDLFVHDYGRSWTVTGGPAPDPIPGLGEEEFHGPRLRLPNREYVLFEAGAAEFLGRWVSLAPWSSSGTQSPSILWPEDRAWVLVCDTDWTSTIIGGPVELMAQLLTDPAVDGAIIPADSALTGLG